MFKFGTTFFVGMRMGFGMHVDVEQRIALSTSQRHSLKLLLSLSQKLKSPFNPLATRGVPGVRLAHDELKEKGLYGFLIGGVAVAGWNSRVSYAELNSHKDVDVYVPDQLGVLTSFDDYSDSIDWWLPESGQVIHRTDYSRAEINSTWVRNINDVVLAFNILPLGEPQPGLYLLDRSDVIEMKITEALASVAESVEVDEDVVDGLRDRLERKVKTVVSDKLTNNSNGIYHNIRIDGASLSKRAAIYSAKGMSENAANYVPKKLRGR